ncbi:MAG: hypothetical protein WDN69_26135 [Aliidongia sp.]
MTAVNAGQSYDRVMEIDVTLPDGSHPKLVSRGKNTYVLPGAHRRWTVQATGGRTAGLSASERYDLGGQK